MQKKCPITDKTFVISEREKALRRKLNIDGDPEFHPAHRIQVLGAFWHHWALHRRTCDRTKKHIISVFSEECPYPVWHRDEWMQYADPPGSDFDMQQPVFEQMWALFQRCPIPHNIGTGNENCEYTDDWWYCKNCYLCHSGFECEDIRYCYRVFHMRNSQYCVFSTESDRCLDLIDCQHCFRVLYAYACHQCSDSAFLYDCRNCHHCLFSSNLRNASYCIGNEQLTKAEYERRVREWDFRSHVIYERGKETFARMLRERGWHRALFIDKCENVSGNYLHECKDCENCFFISHGMQSAVNCMRAGINNRDCLDAVSPFHSELVFNSSLAQDHCYDIKNSYNVMQCKWLEYCAHCFQCERCFSCCGLRGKKYHIFNKPYAPKEYEALRSRIIEKMKSTKEWNRFFPHHFAAQPYEESLSGFYWPLSREEGIRQGFRMRKDEPLRPMDALDASQVPDRSEELVDGISKKVFWDSVAKRPFQITEGDSAFAHDIGAPLPHTYYMRRLQENFRVIPFDGTLRDISCGHCKKQAHTSWPSAYDGRILCEDCYLNTVY